MADKNILINIQLAQQSLFQLEKQLKTISDRKIVVEAELKNFGNLKKEFAEIERIYTILKKGVITPTRGRGAGVERPLNPKDIDNYYNQLVKLAGFEKNYYRTNEQYKKEAIYQAGKFIGEYKNEIQEIKNLEIELEKLNSQYKQTAETKSTFVKKLSPEVKKSLQDVEFKESQPLPLPVKAVVDKSELEQLKTEAAGTNPAIDIDEQPAVDSIQNVENKLNELPSDLERIRKIFQQNPIKVASQIPTELKDFLNNKYKPTIQPTIDYTQLDKLNVRIKEIFQKSAQDAASKIKLDVGRLPEYFNIPAAKPKISGGQYTDSKGGARPKVSKDVETPPTAEELSYLEKLKVKIEAGTASMNDLREASIILNKELRNLAVGSDAYLKKQDELIVTQRKFSDALYPQREQDYKNRLEALGRVVFGLNGYVNSLVGAMAMFSDQSEKSQKELQQLENTLTGMIAFSRGLRDVFEGFVAFDKLLKGKLIASFSSLGKVIIGTDLSLKTLVASLRAVATVFGAVAITGIIVFWDELGDAINGVTKEMRKYLDTQKLVRQTLIEGQEAAQTEVQTLTQYSKIVNDTTKSLEERKRAQEETAEVAEKLGKIDITSTEGLKLYNTEIEKYIKNATARAQADAIIGKIAEQQGELIRMQMQTAEENLSFFEENIMAYLMASDAYDEEFQKSMMNIDKTFEKRDQVARNTQKLYEQLKTVIKDFLPADQVGKGTKETEKLTNALVLQIEAINKKRIADKAATQDAQKRLDIDIEADKQIRDKRLQYLKDVYNFEVKQAKFTYELSDKKVADKEELTNTLSKLQKQYTEDVLKIQNDESQQTLDINDDKYKKLLAAQEAYREASNNLSIRMSNGEQQAAEKTYKFALEKLQEQELKELQQTNLTEQAKQEIIKKYAILRQDAEITLQDSLFDIREKARQRELDMTIHQLDMEKELYKYMAEDISEITDRDIEILINNQQKYQARLKQGSFNALKQLKQLNQNNLDDTIYTLEQKQQAENDAYSKTLSDLRAQGKEQTDQYKDTQAEQAKNWDKYEQDKIKAREGYIQEDINLEQQHQAALRQIASAAFDLSTQMLTSYYDYKRQLRQQDLESELNALEKEKNAKLYAIDAEVQELDRTQLIKNSIEEEYAKKQDDLRKKAFEADKEMQLKEAILLGIMAQARILAETPKIDFGVMTALLMASAAVQTAAQISQIKSTEYVPQYAEGGLVTGPGTGTSDSITAKLSNGEFVMNAKSTAQNLPVLQAINDGKSLMMSDPQLTSTLDILGMEIAALRNKMNEPSKAYIMQSEVNNGLQVSKILNTRRKL